MHKKVKKDELRGLKKLRKVKKDEKLRSKRGGRIW